MKSSAFAARTAVRRQLLATTMLTVIGAGAALLGPQAFAQTADQAAAESGGTMPLPPIDVAGQGAGDGTGAGGESGEAGKPFSQPIPKNIPAVIETVTAKEIRRDINAVTSTDT